MAPLRDKKIIIVGAGAAGLAAARLLLLEGALVTVLEANTRIGGRIWTEEQEGFAAPIERGAEFIHGKAPRTFLLLKRYGISYTKVKGAILKHQENGLSRQRSFIADGRQLTRRLRKIKKDKTVGTFIRNDLRRNKFGSLRKDVRLFVEGYDTADIDSASVMTLKEEWRSMRHAKQFRVEGGYGKLIEALAEECGKLGGTILTRNTVKTIKNSNTGVEVITQNKQKLAADSAIVTIPVALLRSRKGKKKNISFIPALTAVQDKFIRSLGYGSIIKIFFQFGSNVWEKGGGAPGLKRTGFLLSHEKVPTWWTRFPHAEGMLTGWLAGEEFSGKSKRTILHAGLSSLSKILGISQEHLKKELKAWKIMDWSAQRFARGSYAFETPGSRRWIRKNNIVRNRCIYFAGEGFHKGGTGTVEAALESGEDAANKIVRALIRSNSRQRNLFG
jgi:monoamine oxidase